MEFVLAGEAGVIAGFLGKVVHADLFIQQTKLALVEGRIDPGFIQ